MRLELPIQERSRAAEGGVAVVEDGGRHPEEESRVESEEADWVHDDGAPCEQLHVVVSGGVALD